MNLQQIRYFLALSEQRNFRLAAERCKVAQPSVTNAIKALERELGGPLFWRTRPQIELSTLGHAVFPHFARIARELDSMRRTAKRVDRGYPVVGARRPSSASRPRRIA
jgi:LysR family transcriptional regulator, hydrogen peroxide-inducible genes activator